MQSIDRTTEGIENHYSMREEYLEKEWKEKVENYDVMNIFMLYPKGKYGAKDRSFQNLMNVLFRNEHSAEEKLEEMSHICMYYEQKGKKAGLVEGM